MKIINYYTRQGEDRTPMLFMVWACSGERHMFGYLFGSIVLSSFAPGFLGRTVIETWAASGDCCWMAMTMNDGALV